MGLSKPTGAVWLIQPDCPITRRKWYHVAAPREGDDRMADRQIGRMIAAILERDPAEIRIELPDGRLCRIERIPTPK